MKHKTTATWLAFLGGPLGLHRFYLRGPTDLWAWLLPVPTAVGLYGALRLSQLGQDDLWGSWLVPVLGLNIAICCLTAIVYGLMDGVRWNARYNPSASLQHEAGQTHWPTVIGVALSLLVGTTVLMASLVFSFQRYFEYQIEEARKISQ